MSGIFITSLNPLGAAAADGRIQAGDRILKVNGHSLSGLENMEAASVLRNSGNPVRLVLGRKRKKALSPPDGSQPSVTPELPPPFLPSNGVQSPDQSHDQAGSGGPPMTMEEESEEKGGADAEGGRATQEVGEEDGKTEDREGEGETGPTLEEDREQKLIEKWTRIQGSHYLIKVHQCIPRA